MEHKAAEQMKKNIKIKSMIFICWFKPANHFTVYQSTWYIHKLLAQWTKMPSHYMLLLYY